MRYRLYLDESGDHSASDLNDVGRRYLGLVGVAFIQDCGNIPMKESALYRGFSDSFDGFKRNIFGEDPPVLHREEILRQTGDFSVLQDRDLKKQFDEGLLSAFSTAQCWIVSVVVDKHHHGRTRYRSLEHPYHYALHAMLERYCGYLKHTNSTGDVMAESRGRVEDMALKRVYEEVYQKGTRYLEINVCQKTLSSHEIKIKPKHAGIHGLQLADLLAHPLTRDVLYAYGRTELPGGDFRRRLLEIAESKYNRQIYNGRINGYGRVLLA